MKRMIIIILSFKWIELIKNNKNKKMIQIKKIIFEIIKKLKFKINLL